MKKRFFAVIGIVVLFVAVGCVLYIRSKELGSMNKVVTVPETCDSAIYFNCEAGDRIKFSFKSKVDNGVLDMVLYDSDGNVVYELDYADALECFYTVDRGDTYALVAECDDFAGSYSIKVYLAN